MAFKADDLISPQLLVAGALLLGGVALVFYQLNRGVEAVSRGIDNLNPLNTITKLLVGSDS